MVALIGVHHVGVHIPGGEDDVILENAVFVIGVSKSIAIDIRAVLGDPVSAVTEALEIVNGLILCAVELIDLLLTIHHGICHSGHIRVLVQELDIVRHILVDQLSQIQCDTHFIQGLSGVSGVSHAHDVIILAGGDHDIELVSLGAGYHGLEIKFKLFAIVFLIQQVQHGRVLAVVGVVGGIFILIQQISEAGIALTASATARHGDHASQKHDQGQQERNALFHIHVLLFNFSGTHNIP